MPRELRTGRLLAIGGNERRDPEGEILRRFVEMAGGAQARLIVCAVAMEDPQEPLREYERVFRKIGAAKVHTAPFSTRASGTERTLLGALEEATAVFFTGGDQPRGQTPPPPRRRGRPGRASMSQAEQASRPQGKSGGSSAADSSSSGSSGQGSSEERSYLLGLARGFGAAIIFALPMLMTMEMWWLGFYTGRLRLAIAALLLLPLLIIST